MDKDRYTTALIADSSSTEDSKYGLFDPFVGSWKFDLFWYSTGEERLAGRGEWHWSWILNGRAVQDVWECYTVAESGRLVELGTTLRMYDRARGNWRIVFFSPVRGFVDTLVADRAGDEIVLQGIGRSGNPCLWIFSDV